MDGGWIRLYRKLREHWLWPSDRPYSALEAWLDLILSANHKTTMINAGFNIRCVDRGQFLTSQIKLSKKWQWHRETVSKFLRMLERQEMASIQTSNKTSTGYTLITIRNYGKYQDSEENATDTQADTRTSDQTTVERQSNGTNNNEKNEKNTNLSLLNGSNRRNGTEPTVDPDFERAWLLFPKRAGGNSKKDAHGQWRARIRAGVDTAEMLAGTERYAAYIRATGREGTEYVKQARTFFGKGEHWREKWQIPANGAGVGGFVG